MGTVTRLGRRRALAALVCAPFTSFAQPAPTPVRSLAFHHTHTDERLEVTYFENGSYLTQPLAAVEYLLRDFRTGELHAIDVRLLDILHTLTDRCGKGCFEVISGFRSPVTNAHLRATTEGVASNSLHLTGRAIDVRLRGCDTARLRAAAMALAEGGVGYYPQSNFVHLDTGRVRSWG
jgi:uncharacterized protein YcbK (DUF882 family)